MVAPLVMASVTGLPDPPPVAVIAEVAGYVGLAGDALMVIACGTAVIVKLTDTGVAAA
jgi:hypothetical protein